MAPPRTSLLARAAIVDTLSRGLQKAWDRGWLPPIVLEPDILWARAAKGHNSRDESSGRSEKDAADFRERLDALCASLNREAQLTPLGRAAAHGLLTRAIGQRLALGKLWREKPELLTTEIAPPILVVGQMRSGTTRIHRLLAADPAHSATRFCDSWNPLPETFDLRPLRSMAALFVGRRLNPWLETIHPFGAARPDEELGWLAAAFDHCAYEVQWHIPAFVAFSEARDPAPLYREFARILCADAAHRGNAGRPRIMKVPQFSEDLATLLAQFPDARLVVSRRSDADTLRSAVSLVANQMAMQSDHADLERITQECRRKIALRADRMEKALAGFAGAVAEVDFEALGADWLAETERIYDALGLPLSDQAIAAMRREQDQASKGAHHAHQSQLAQITRH
ncbi:sulfotransferase family protein [Pontixanthobacter aquaemixtae]|uniref:Sulfotransferase n=1 Tax=Pontixanthobacter aquaemixtae TaxID=1958940 RepID=A0A844ZVI7_9SPHN|nr:sulfotransferase [Pontixanthobacter aquaemixtae]MXO90767.1 sulfotransferase [Pontixanthobacter aquaemixtae]